MLVVQDHVRGVVQAPRQVDQGAVSKLMDLEDTVIDVGDPIDVILKDIDAEGVTQAWGEDVEGTQTLVTLSRALASWFPGTSNPTYPKPQAPASPSSRATSAQGPSPLDFWSQDRLLLPLPFAKFLLPPPCSSTLIDVMNEGTSGPEGRNGPWACRAGAGKAPQGCRGPGWGGQQARGGRGLGGEDGGPRSGQGGHAAVRHTPRLLSAATMGSVPLSRMLPMTESLASAQ